mmetsp:Transcript_23667/g.75814  ORF Transcript_23667/g.75814 Transcript_23667/m.75814 type:complete len:351 (-) Transcript_23667:990-2042(-)
MRHRDEQARLQLRVEQRCGAGRHGLAPRRDGKQLVDHVGGAHLPDAQLGVELAALGVLLQPSENYLVLRSSRLSCLHSSRSQRGFERLALAHVLQQRRGDQASARLLRQLAEQHPRRRKLRDVAPEVLGLRRLEEGGGARSQLRSFLARHLVHKVSRPASPDVVEVIRERSTRVCQPLAVKDRDLRYVPRHLMAQHRWVKLAEDRFAPHRLVERVVTGLPNVDEQVHGCAHLQLEDDSRERVHLCAQRVPTAPGRLARVHGPRHHLQARAQKLLNHRASEATVRRVHLPENSHLARALVHCAPLRLDRLLKAAKAVVVERHGQFGGLHPYLAHVVRVAAATVREALVQQR